MAALREENRGDAKSAEAAEEFWVDRVSGHQRDVVDG